MAEIQADAVDSLKRKEPETEKAEEKKTEETAVATDEPDSKRPKTTEEAESGKAEEKKAAPEIAVKPAAASGEPDAKRPKTSPDLAAVRKQIEYYLSDDNLKFDQFFHEKITGTPDGWLDVSLVLSCNKMKAMRATKEDVLEALKESKIEMKDDKQSIRRPGNLALPSLEKRPEKHQKKSTAQHDGGVICTIKGIPEEQSWMQIKEKLRAKLPDKVQLWFVSEVSDKNTSLIACAPFENDLQFFEDLTLEVGGVNLKAEALHGDPLQQALKVLPKHIKDKREKEARKKQKERNRPIVVGQQRFVNVGALRSRVKEILNSRSDGEALKVDGSDYKLIKALLDFHPKGAEKSKGMIGIKVAKSVQGDSRCFYMLKDGGKEEDFSAVKCLSAIEANPPYVAVESKKEESTDAGKEEQKKEAPKEEAKPAETPKAEEKKAEAESTDGKKEEEKKEESK